MVISPSSFCILFADVLMDFAFFGNCFTFFSSSLFLEPEPEPGPDSLIFCNFIIKNFTSERIIMFINTLIEV